MKDLLTNNYKSTPRNKLIADFCKSLGLIEKYGSGIRRIIEYFKSVDLPAPDFRNISDGFMVTIYLKEKEDITDRVTDNQKKIIDYLKNSNRLSTAELALKVGISQRKIKENIRKLKGIGLLSRIGSEKSGYWVVTKES